MRRRRLLHLTFADKLAAAAADGSSWWSLLLQEPASSSSFSTHRALRSEILEENKDQYHTKETPGLYDIQTVVFTFGEPASRPWILPAAPCSDAELTEDRSLTSDSKACVFKGTDLAFTDTPPALYRQ